MQCYNCGSALNGTETMCPMCGAQLNQYTNQPMQNGMNGQMGNMGQPNQMMQNQTIPEQAPMMEQNMSMNSMQQYQQGMPMNQNEFAYYAQNGNNVGYQNQTNMGFPTAPNQMGQMPVPPMNEISLASETEEQPKVSKTMLIIIFASAALFIILGIVLAITTPKEEEEPVITPTPTPTETTTPIQSSTVNYGGYTFNILDGYTTKQDEKYGLIFNNGNIAYSVKVDYTNNYNTYKQILSQNYPTQAQ
ncbi:MAG: hypothetical protein IKE70_04540, partial [Bacilli bacterium]|nr:hypothetical protein [Bacilli bacterium]